MATETVGSKKIVVQLFKDFSLPHTVTSLAKELRVSRVGVWKIVKKLEVDNFINIIPAGAGKTSTFLVTINWKNILVEKSLSLFLTEEALAQRRWRANFAELEKSVDFLILYGSILHAPHEANDIDLIGVISQKNKFVKIQQSIDIIQKTQSKKIHLINFTESEFKQELLKPNKVFISAIKKGVILFGQENFIQFMKGVH